MAQNEAQKIKLRVKSKDQTNIQMVLAMAASGNKDVFGVEF